jgi:drug/metabolite transporter (DMT)-like permease
MKSSDNQAMYKPVLASALGILFVSTASIFIRFAQSEASSIVIACSRLVIASLVLVPLALIKNSPELKMLHREDFIKAGLAGFFLAMHFTSWISSLEYTSVASSVVLVTTTPLWVALFSPIVLKEQIRKPVIFGLVISMGGSVIVGLGNACQFMNGTFECRAQALGGRAMIGNFLALFGAWMAAGYMLMGRQLRKKLNTLSYTSLVYGIAAFILTIITLIRREPVFSYSPPTYLWLIALGLIPQLLGHSLFNWALKYVSAAYVSLTLLGEPIGTIILALIFLKESPTFLEGIGSGLILIGIVVASLWRSKRTSEA